MVLTFIQVALWLVYVLAFVVVLAGLVVAFILGRAGKETHPYRYAAAWALASSTLGVMAGMLMLDRYMPGFFTVMDKISLLQALQGADVLQIILVIAATVAIYTMMYAIAMVCGASSYRHPLLVPNSDL